MVFEPTTSCLRIRDVSRAPQRHRQQREYLIWFQFMLQWFIRFYGILQNSTECVFIRKNSNFVIEIGPNHFKIITTLIRHDLLPLASEGRGNPLKEHQKFRTNATTSLISDLLKSMGGIFSLKNLQISQRSWHIFRKLVYTLTMLCVVICYQFIFKCNWARNQRKLQFCLTTPTFIIWISDMCRKTGFNQLELVF